MICAEFEAMSDGAGEVTERGGGRFDESKEWSLC